MGSVPLAALSVRPIEQPDILANAGRAMQLSNLAQQQKFIPGQLQEQQNQLQSQNLGIQQQQQQLKDQQASTAALQQWDGKDVEAIPGLILKNGGSANAVFGAKKQILDQKTALTKLDSDTLTNNAQKNDLLLGGLQAALSGPDEGLGQRVQQAAQDAIQKGLIDPQHAQAIQQLTSLDPAKMRDSLSIMEKGMMGQKEQFTQVMDQKKQEVEQQKANAADWKSDPGTGALINVRTGEMKTVDGQMSPQMADSKYRNIQQAKTLGRPVTPEDKAWAGAYEKQKSLVPTATFNMNQGSFANAPKIAPGATGSDALSQMDPKMASMIKMVGDYKQKSSEITARMPPAAKANFLSALNAAYPNYDENEFPTRSKMLTSFTSGPESKQIGAINTAMGHIGVLDSAIEALNNGHLKPLNALENKLGLQADSTPAAAFNTIVHRVGPELAAAYIQGGGGEGERGTTAADFDVNLGPKTLHNNAAITTQLLRSKIGSMEKQWNGTMKPGTPDQQFQSRFITPEAQATLDRLAPTRAASAAGGVKVTAPDGSVHTFPDQKSADNFKQLAHIQ